MLHEGELAAGRYLLESVLGVGGMGRVWRATDQLLGRTVAVKELFAAADGNGADDVAARAAAEAKAAARLSHPAIVTVHDVIVDPAVSLIVMQYVPGLSLQQHVEQHGPMPPAAAARIGLSILDALAHAHARQVLHRDVKPSNVLMTEQGQVFVTDFSIARVVTDAMRSHTGLAFGSPGYVAPERILTGRMGAPGDYFGLGAVLYFLVEGVSPFSHSDPMVGLFASASRPHEPAVNAGTDGLAEVIEGLLVKDPNQRMPADRARELLLAASGGAAAPQPAAPPPIPRPVTMVLAAAPQPTAAAPVTPLPPSAHVTAASSPPGARPSLGTRVAARSASRWVLRSAVVAGVAVAVVITVILVKVAGERQADGPGPVTTSTPGSSAAGSPSAAAVSRADRYTAAVLAARPVDYFPLRERAGTAAANSASGPSAVYHGVRLAAVEGPFGPKTPAASFGGAEGGPGGGPAFVELPRRDSPVRSRPLSVTLWFRAAGPGVLYGTAKKPLLEYLEFGLEPSLYVGTDGLLHAGYYDSGVRSGPAKSMTTRARVDDRRWHHVVLTKSADGRDEVLYLDGAQAGSRRLKGPAQYLVPSYAYAGGGKWSHWAETTGDVGYLSGGLSDFAYFDRVLGAPEVSTLFEAARG
ncbi:protein kinase [Catellatospora sp. KI3]|uniref:protein kinase domain-containing protein n=1 Tax=Catellatospora sp. KI3 TaxID=3041620 RepID=UPI002483009A|nr:protein kinase [Catellatospora sp. KI3]MDI1461252.1 protein kinase [Catellatospora sp. KI3]